MAVIGTTLHLANHKSLNSWDPAWLDTSLNAVLQELGGSTGAGVYGGNLDSTNFASGMRLPKAYLAQPRHRKNLYLDRSDTVNIVLYALCPYPITVQSVGIGLYEAQAYPATVSGSVKILVNGVTVATISTDAVLSAAGAKVFFYQSQISLAAGDIVAVDMTACLVSGSNLNLYDPQVILSGFSEHTA